MTEPLKDKIQTRIGLEYDDGTKKLKEVDPYFDYDDIKSSVKWLKEELKKYFDKHYIEGTQDILFPIIIKKIEKAFEDVIKND